MQPQAVDAPRPAPSPVMDVVAPPAQERQAAVESSPQPTTKHETPKTQAKTAPKAPPKPKQPGSGVGVAIFATVVIVLGLAAMATYAYLKTVQ